MTPTARRRSRAPREENYKSQRAVRALRHVLSLSANGRKRRVSLLPPLQRARANWKLQSVCVFVCV